LVGSADIVGTRLGDWLGGTVGALLGDPDGPPVGNKLGTWVGGAAGALLGDPDGLPVGWVVGGGIVGADVGVLAITVIPVRVTLCGDTWDVHAKPPFTLLTMVPLTPTAHTRSGPKEAIAIKFSPVGEGVATQLAPGPK